MTQVIRPIGVDDVQAAVGISLLDMHREESCSLKDLFVLKPDWFRYRELLDSQLGYAQGLFEFGVLVGYCVSFVGPHIHYSDAIVAQNDVLFLAPRYREGRAGLRLMREAELEAKERGACVYFWHAKPDTPLDRILRTQQLPVQDTIYGRRL